MSAEIELTCDGCGLPIRGNPGMPRNDYLVLSCATAPTERTGQAIAMVAIAPMLEHDHHFHNPTCLSTWVAALPPPRMKRTA